MTTTEREPKPKELRKEEGDGKEESRSGERESKESMQVGPSILRGAYFATTFVEVQ